MFVKQLGNKISLNKIEISVCRNPEKIILNCFIYHDMKNSFLSHKKK